MKRLLVQFIKILFFLTVVSVAQLGNAVEEYRVIGVAEDDTLNVRSSYGSEYPIIYKLAPNQSGIISTGSRRKNGPDEWLQISINGKLGWVRSAYLEELEYDTSNDGKIRLPRFISERWPYADFEASVVWKYDQRANLKEIGFEDLSVPVGTLRLEVRCYLRQEFLYCGRWHSLKVKGRARSENEDRLFLAIPRYDQEGPGWGDPTKRHNLVGVPDISVTLYCDQTGSWLENLPTTIEFFPRYESCADFSPAGGPTSSHFEPEIEELIRTTAATPADDPVFTNPKLFWSISGIMNNQGPNGLARVIPFRYVSGSGSKISTSTPYFAIFDQGRISRKIDFGEFAGPLAVQAAEKRREAGLMVFSVAGAVLLGGGVILADGAINIGKDMVAGLQTGGGSNDVDPGLSSSTKRGGSEMHTFAKLYAGGYHNFTCTRDANVGKGNMSPWLTLKASNGKEWAIQYSVPMLLSGNRGSTGGLATNDSQSLVGTIMNVRFNDSGEPVSIKNTANGNHCEVKNWKVSGYGW
jgi:hypothetical protein